jgi:hypothetical protein
MLVMSARIMRVSVPKAAHECGDVRAAQRSMVQIVPMLVSMCHRLMFVLVPFGQT